jgi:uncharacterized protein
MKKIDKELVGIAERYVMNLLDKQLPKEFVFHSTAHTQNVTAGARYIGRKTGFDEYELLVLQICALFHDVGYITANENHEAESAFMVGEFLRSCEISETEILFVQKAILATKVPQQPVGKLAEVLCDADLMHLTGVDYFDQMELLREEWQITGRYQFTEKQFHEHSIKFFKNHHYHSEYGKSVMALQKEDTLKRIMYRLEFLNNTDRIVAGR